MNLDCSKHQKNMQTKGYTIIDDFLPNNLAEELNELYLAEDEKEWEFIDQTRKDHYSHVFTTKNPLLPKENEDYRAKFWRSKRLESLKRFNDIFNDNFKEKIKQISAANLTEVDHRCYRLKQGDYYRLHIDSYAGKVNSIYYVNRNWVWDWGGILHICKYDDPEYIRPIFPKFNRLVLVHNQKFCSPHFISQVSEFALNPRFSVVSFNK